MFHLKINEKLIIFIAAILSAPFFVLAANDVQIVNDANFELNTLDTSALTAITASSGGQVTNFNVQPNYIDITLDNLSSVVFTTTTGGQFFKIVKQSGSDDYTVSPSCPTASAALTGTGATVILRLEVLTADTCATPLPPPGPGGGGGGGPAPEPALIISELQAPDITAYALTLTWKTNFPSSSYVIYSAEGQEHSLDMADIAGTPPKYGYANATPEYDTDAEVTYHLVTITGLDFTTTNYFRTVSRGSLAISGEYKITIPSSPVARAAEQATEGEIIGQEAENSMTPAAETAVIPIIEEMPETQPVSLPALPSETANPPATSPNPFTAGFSEVWNKTFGSNMSKLFLFLLIAVIIIILVSLFFPLRRRLKKK